MEPLCGCSADHYLMNFMADASGNLTYSVECKQCGKKKDLPGLHFHLFEDGCRSNKVKLLHELPTTCCKHTIPAGAEVEIVKYGTPNRVTVKYGENLHWVKRSALSRCTGEKI